VHSLYRAFLYTVLLPVLGMLILCGLLSHQIVGKGCIIIIIIIIIIITTAIIGTVTIFLIIIDVFIVARHDEKMWKFVAL
jgi:hypothetical protein